MICWQNHETFKTFVVLSIPLFTFDEFTQSRKALISWYHETFKTFCVFHFSFHLRRVHSKTEGLNLLVSNLFRAQSAASFLKSAFRLWLYVACLLALICVRNCLDILEKVGAYCCGPESRGFDRIGNSEEDEASSIVTQRPFSYTPHARLARDSEGRKLLNSYLLIRTIDTGSNGRVKLAIDINTREYFAIKKYNKTLLKKKKLGLQRNEFENVMREIGILQRLKHPNIMQLYEVIDDPQSDYIYLIMEYLAGGSILSKQQQVERLSENEARSIFVDIACGLEYLHANRVIHRDIKPDNIVLTADGKVAKICDFSVSHVFEDDDDRLSSSAGAPAFLAPELVSIKGQSHGKATDIWALGVTLYYFIYGTCPFLGASVPAIYERIQNQEVSFQPLPNGSYPSPQLQDLMLKLMTKDPKRRILMKEIKTHPWCAELFKQRSPQSPSSSSPDLTPKRRRGVAKVSISGDKRSSPSPSPSHHISVSLPANGTRSVAIQ